MARKTAQSKIPDNVESFETELLRHSRAREALDNLTLHRKVPRDLVLTFLFSIPRAPTRTKLVPNMENRNLKALPRRIREWAETIERLNNSPWLTPDHLESWARDASRAKRLPKPLNITLDRRWSKAFADQFRDLPRSLRFYADNLSACIDLFHGRGRRALGVSGPIRPRILFTLQLIKVVRDADGGRSHYRQLATLLEHAYLVCGEHQTVSEEGLSKLEHDNEWVAALVFHPDIFSSP